MILGQTKPHLFHHDFRILTKHNLLCKLMSTKFAFCASNMNLETNSKPIFGFSLILRFCRCFAMRSEFKKKKNKITYCFKTLSKDAYCAGAL